MGTSALQMMEEAGTQGADCPLQTQWVRLAAILMQQIMWSEFFWGMCDRHQLALSRSSNLSQCQDFMICPQALLFPI